MSGAGGILVANSLLRIAFRENAPMRLQRLLYVTCALYGRTTGRPLTAERFRPWRTGPVLEGVHYKFRDQTHPIDSYCPGADGGVWSAGAARGRGPGAARRMGTVPRPVHIRPEPGPHRPGRCMGGRDPDGRRIHRPRGGHG